jgi:hypothetical protein
MFHILTHKCVTKCNDTSERIGLIYNSQKLGWGGAMDSALKTNTAGGGYSLIEQNRSASSTTTITFYNRIHISLTHIKSTKVIYINNFSVSEEFLFTRPTHTLHPVTLMNWMVDVFGHWESRSSARQTLNRLPSQLYIVVEVLDIKSNGSNIMCKLDASIHRSIV